VLFIGRGYNAGMWSFYLYFRMGWIGRRGKEKGSDIFSDANLSSILDDYRACLLDASYFLLQSQNSSLSNFQAHVIICPACCGDVTTVNIDCNLAVDGCQFLM
jgi:hypothetical protein